MQFAGKQGIAVFVLLILSAVAVGFGSGLLVGRQFPAHHYERWGDSTNYLLDTATGKVCDRGPFATAKNSEKAYGSDSLAILDPAVPPPCGK